MRASDLDQITIAVISIRLHASWCHSLKEKRMVVKSLITKIQHRFHVSVAETDAQDQHQTIVIGIAAIVPDRSFADQLMENIVSFIAENTDAEIIADEYEIR